ncbi:MAG: RNA helicase [Chrysothrix sp. TS-e1954]|nr:MAG: RNA helicase [Chrysothrix sp. TS-e1954]
MNIVLPEARLCRACAIRSGCFAVLSPCLASSLASGVRGAVRYTLDRRYYQKPAKIRRLQSGSDSGSRRREVFPKSANLKTAKREARPAGPHLSKPTITRNQVDPVISFSQRVISHDEVDYKIGLQLSKLKDDVLQPGAFGSLAVDPRDLRKQWRNFGDRFARQQDDSKTRDEDVQRVRELVRSKPRQSELHRTLRQAFLQHVISGQLNVKDEHQQELLLDCKYPTEWYPRARQAQREVHLHIGPTNSGKTYQALKKLEQARTGVYAGPLRLLAHEVYERLNAKGRTCALLTGDDRRTGDDDHTERDPMWPRKLSCTVEMTPLTRGFDVAVIDEIQMLADEQRGWAWTQALLGLNAKEIHLCGEERVLHIITTIAALCGDKLHIHRYKRLSPLAMMRRSLEGDITRLQKRDCLVGFSIVMLHAMRQLIEKRLKKKCAVVYGGLPAETRAQQAKLFNDPDNDYDFLVASNAIGMGLNLDIGRLIFQSAGRIVNGAFLPLKNHEVKQIAGRAGRYSTAAQDMTAAAGTPARATKGDANIVETVRDRGGLVTTLEKFDYGRISQAMESEPEAITSAGLLPPDTLITRFAKRYPAGTPFSFILSRVVSVSGASDRFFICDMWSPIAVAEAIDTVDGLTVPARLTFCASPVDPRKPEERKFARALAQKVADNQDCSVLDFPELELELLEDDYVADRKYLYSLEKLNKLLVIYAWVSYRFIGIFLQIELAQHVRSLVETRTNETLSKLSFDYEMMQKQRERTAALAQNEPEADENIERDQDDNEQVDGESLDEGQASANKNNLANHSKDVDDASGVPRLPPPDTSDVIADIEAPSRSISVGAG